MCSQELILFGMQKPKSKWKVFKCWPLKKCLSIIRKFLTGWLPTVNSTVAPTFFNLRNWNVRFTFKATRSKLVSITYLGCELISHKSTRIWINFIVAWLYISWRLGYLEQGCIAMKIPDFESREIYLINIVLWRTKVILSDGEVFEDLSRTCHSLSVLNNISIYLVNYTSNLLQTDCYHLWTSFHLISILVQLICCISCKIHCLKKFYIITSPYTYTYLYIQTIRM